MVNKIFMLTAIVAVIGITTTAASVKAFSYTGDGATDGQNAAREDFNSGQNDDSCNDHFSNNPNFNVGNEGYCAAFKIAYAGEMVALGATK